MKFIQKKSLILSGLICLLPIPVGVALWKKLPETMAIHFNVWNEADGFAPRWMVVFGLPLLMLALQVLCCIINDIHAAKHGSRPKLEAITKSIIPVLTIVLQAVTLGYGLGWSMDMRKIVALLVGLILLAVGNYQPKLDYIKDYDIKNTEKARKINRFIGYATVLVGLLFVISAFLPPVGSVVCLFLLIPYMLACVLYGIKVGRGKKN